MNLFNHEQKMKMLNDKLQSNKGGANWSKNIAQLVKKNHAAKFNFNQM